MVFLGNGIDIDYTYFLKMEMPSVDGTPADTWKSFVDGWTVASNCSVLVFSELKTSGIAEWIEQADHFMKFKEEVDNFIKMVESSDESPL